MPNGHGPKEYGGHKYAKHDGTSDCEYGCGCWMGPARSGGPTGLDPRGACPNNPIDGKRLGGKSDYDHVVTARIEDLSSRLWRAEERLRKVKPSKENIVRDLELATSRLNRRDQLLVRIRQLIDEENIK